MKFIINKKFNLICTNVHVFSNALFSTCAIFFKRENFEFNATNVNVFIIYINFVHDFVFARYNTKNLKINYIKLVQFLFV